MHSSLKCCLRVWFPWWASSCCLWVLFSCWLVRSLTSKGQNFMTVLTYFPHDLDHGWPVAFSFPQARFLRGQAVSTPCLTPPMQKTTFPSLPLSQSISQPPGPPIILIFSCWSLCFQASAASVGTCRITICLSSMMDTVFSFLTVGLYYCFSNLSDARIFIIMYGVTSMYFSAVMVCPVIIWTDIFAESYLFAFFCHTLPWLPNDDEPDFVLPSGSFDVGPGSSHVYSVRYWCVPGVDNLHEEFRCKPARQEEQETTGFNLPHQKWGRTNRWPVKAGVCTITNILTKDWLIIGTDSQLFQYLFFLPAPNYVVCNYLITFVLSLAPAIR